VLPAPDRHQARCNYYNDRCKKRAHPSSEVLSKKWSVQYGAGSKTTTVEAAVPAAIMVRFLQATRLPLQRFTRCVRMNPANFLDWKTIVESRIQMIEATDADKTPHLFDPAVHLTRSGR
jgi:hypothetical protein